MGVNCIFPWVGGRAKDVTQCLSGCKILPKLLKVMNLGIN